MLDNYIDLVWKYFPYARRNAPMLFGSASAAIGIPLLLMTIIFIYSVGKDDGKGNIVLPNSPLVQVISFIGAPFAITGLGATYGGVLLYCLGSLCKADEK